MLKSTMGRAVVYFVGAGSAVVCIGLIAALFLIPDGPDEELARAPDFESTGQMYVEVDARGG